MILTYNFQDNNKQKTHKDSSYFTFTILKYNPKRKLLQRYFVKIDLLNQNIDLRGVKSLLTVDLASILTVCQDISWKIKTQLKMTLHIALE